VLLDEKEIEGVKLESKKTLELTQFVDSHDIDAIYFDKPYYVVPADDLAEEAFVVLREALKRSHKIGLGQLAMRGREYVVSIKGCGRGMVMETLRYADEVHKAASYFGDIGDTKPDDDLLDLAQTLIDKKTGKFDAAEFHDRYVDALKDLIERKKKGKTITIEDDNGADPRGSNVVDLMAALKKSLGSSGGKGAATEEKAEPKRRRPRRRHPPRRRPPSRQRSRRRASVPDRGGMLAKPGSASEDDASAFAEGAITLWANLLTLMATHLREQECHAPKCWRC
jgi:DNA end-binding protein Ku